MIGKKKAKNLKEPQLRTWSEGRTSSSWKNTSKNEEVTEFDEEDEQDQKVIPTLHQTTLHLSLSVQFRHHV